MVTENNNKFTVVKTIEHIMLGLIFFCGVVGLGYLLLDNTGVFATLNTQEKFMAFLKEYQGYAVLVFIVIQFLQVSVLPIPAAVTTVAGAVFFGPEMAIVYSLIAIITASLFSFGLGRWFGKPFVGWMIGKETMDKWVNKTKGKEKTVFFTMFLLPVFPDDILCMVAGITKMKWSFFTIMNLITRPIGIVMTCYFLGGTLIPYDTWWGIMLYGMGIVLCITMLIISWKYSEQIQNFFIQTGEKIKVKISQMKKKKGT